MFVTSFPRTGVCLVVAVGLTQDLALSLLTKNTKQNKTNKQKNKHSHWEEDMLLVHDINSRNLPNGIIGRDYASHTSSESSKSLDFKSN